VHFQSHLWIIRAFGPSLPWTGFLGFQLQRIGNGLLINGVDSGINTQAEWALFTLPKKEKRKEKRTLRKRHRFAVPAYTRRY
jgi:hypothetical protein